MSTSSPVHESPAAWPELAGRFHRQVTARLEQLAHDAATGAFDSAIDLLTSGLDAGGVIQAFGTGHSEAFAMEMAGRAGGLIATNKIALRDVVVRGSRDRTDLSGSNLERDPGIVDELFDLTPVGTEDVFIIASNSGVNGSIVGLALRAKQSGHPVIAVTSMEHTMAVEPKHPSGLRLCEVADVALDNRAPYGDTVLDPLGGVPLGAVSSITSAYIAQLLTIGTAQRIAATGRNPPLYISANIPGGDEHNRSLEDLYAGRITRTA